MSLDTEARIRFTADRSSLQGTIGQLQTTLRRVSLVGFGLFGLSSLQQALLPSLSNLRVPFEQLGELIAIRREVRRLQAEFDITLAPIRLALYSILVELGKMALSILRPLDSLATGISRTTGFPKGLALLGLLMGLFFVLRFIFSGLRGIVGDLVWLRVLLSRIVATFRAAYVILRYGNIPISIRRGIIGNVFWSTLAFLLLMFAHLKVFFTKFRISVIAGLFLFFLIFESLYKVIRNVADLRGLPEELNRNTKILIESLKVLFAAILTFEGIRYMMRRLAKSRSFLGSRILGLDPLLVALFALINSLISLLKILFPKWERVLNTIGQTINRAFGFGFLGALIGSFFGPSGTWIGAILGAVIGALLPFIQEAMKFVLDYFGIVPYFESAEEKTRRFLQGSKFSSFGSFFTDVVFRQFAPQESLLSGIKTVLIDIDRKLDKLVNLNRTPGVSGVVI